ncbi:MAG: RagB/SusD family nutrient uptake outer membrane protein, partial [Muribaculaceae bacterium]|nr:RagB/SusD family nutrient uptake outer membrane protein [Muribaculaceae bacterium]
MGTSTVTGNADVAQQAVYGICKAMLSQYANANWNNNNGECYINNLFNDGLGQDYHNGLTENVFNATYLDFNNNNITSPSLIINAYPWKYAYNLISQANNILGGIDNAEGDSKRRDFVKAQALTFRAFGYSKLLMLYAPRWEDSKDGEALCLVLRTTPGTEPQALSSMNDVLKQCYEDLDEAIELYSSCGLDRTYKWEPNLDVAYGVYTRIALVKNDWPKAQDMAHKARASYPVMDNETLFSGFYTDNSDFMWVSSDDETNGYYFSNGSNYSANGAYVQNWNMGAGAIDLGLYRALDPNDVRREMFYTPDKVTKYANNVKMNPGKLVPADYWNSELVDPANLCNTAIGPTAKPKVGKWGMCHVGIHFAEDYINDTYTGDKNNINNDGFMAYYAVAEKQESGYFLWGAGTYVKLYNFPIGAQFKFFSNPPYGSMSFPFMRGTEMCLAEAEAAYHNGDYTTAQACLNEINGK